MKRRSLGFKLIVGGISAVLIPIVVVGVFSIMKASSSLDNLAKEQAANIAKDISNMAGLVLQEEMKLASNLAVGESAINAATSSRRGGAEGAADEIEMSDRSLTAVMKKFGHDYEVIFVADSNGSIISDGVGGSYKGVSIADRDYFVNAKRGDINLGSVIESKITGKPVLPIGAPIFSASGEFVSMLATIIKTEFLTEKMTGIKIGSTGYPFIVNREGIVIAHPNKDFILSLDVKKLQGMEMISKRMLARETGVESYVFKGTPKIAAFTPIELTGWGVAVTQDTAEFMASVYAIRNLILIVGALFLGITIVTVLFFSRSITRPITSAVAMLNEAADQVATASSQVSSASQSLAEGSSESASAIEETSSSLEEMASMTRQNADNATQADSLMKDANQVVTRADQSMTDLTGSMEEISRASEETSKIIKTIDEIAFQTNLLALNAAVEAARAGEAGAGFAVVADEVRNLAMRAADAAKNTANLIEGSVKKIKEGSELVAKTNEAFGEVTKSSAKVGELVAEIAAASAEQAQGIDQVNKAIAEMDKVTQQNAANAEESASASEEMNAQAAQLKDVATQLLETIGGSGNGHGGAVMGRLQRSGNGRRRSLAAATKDVVIARKKEVRPDQVIPLDDGEFQDF